ncbi:MAG: response regulator transcription factor [Rhodobacteraceae bacterium]|nr:response regulator transcription factor [Paracoccaceae bacterium]
MRQANILIVDDDIELSEEVAEVLHEQGFSALFARTLLQFDQQLRDHHIDRFVVDLLLPDGHGHKIIRKIRQFSSAGIVVLSGKLNEVDKVVSLELGADDYVVKPFARSEFIARIKSLLRRIEPQHSRITETDLEGSEINFAGWRTEPNARRIFSPADEQVHLTKLEFDLWITFLKGLDRVLARDQLIYSIRGRDWAGYDRSIDGLVSRLRKKLAIDPNLEESF